MEEASIFDEFEFGASWTQNESMERCSHALIANSRAWLIDPVDSAGDVERAVGDAEPAGVIQLLDRHNRDCAGVAERLGVPHLRLPHELGGSPFEVFSVINRPKWREVGLWWPERRALVVSESLGTSAAFAVGDTGVMVHPLVRLVPPTAPRRYPRAEHLLPGHGRPLHAPDTGARVARALGHARRDIPRMLLRLPSIALGSR
ncbi:MAG: hypothetical protein QM648_03225 [Solirubrobacterales bacterium]